MRTDSHHRVPLFAAPLIAVVLLGSACVSARYGPVTVSLAQLATNERAYDGRDVQTQGTIRQIQDPDGAVYDVIEDNGPNRVEVNPASAAGPYVNQPAVIGTFHYDDQQGRWISVDHIGPPGT